MLNHRKRAVFFDFGDTLASTTPPYIARIGAALREAGYPVAHREFESAYLRADYKIYERYKSKGQVSPLEYGEWFFPILCEILRLEAEPSAIRRDIREVLRGKTFGRETLKGAIELLEHLKGSGFRLGIISNNDGRTHEKCDEVEIRKYFDVILDSTNVGLTKPDARIFQYALDKLNLAADDAVHVGDLYGSDAMGGRNAGLEVIWLNARGVQPLDHAPVIEVGCLLEIKTLLGSGG
ncbi:MAG: HAD family hydrolase [Deltaproteobacteria bacterium]